MVKFYIPNTTYNIQHTIYDILYTYFVKYYTNQSVCRQANSQKNLRETAFVGRAVDNYFYKSLIYPVRCRLCLSHGGPKRVRL